MAKAQAKARDARSNAEDEQRPSWLSNALRFDRYGNAISETGAMLVHRLPDTEDARETIMSTAQRAVGRARGTVSSAIDQLPEISLPDSLPGRKKQSKSGPSRLMIIGIVAALGAAGYFAYRWLNGCGQPMDYGIQESWPAEPSPGPTNEPFEDDAQASKDAEESAAVLGGAAAPSQLNQ